MIYIAYIAFSTANPVVEQNLIEFRDLHQSAATIANESGRSGYIYGPFANDLFECIERAREIGGQVSGIENYGIRIIQGSSTISYEYNALSNIIDLEREYTPAESFSCVRYSRNNELVVYFNR